MTATTVDIGTALTITRHTTSPWHAISILALIFAFALIVAITLGKLFAKRPADNTRLLMETCPRCRKDVITVVERPAVHCLGCHTDYTVLEYLHHPCARVKVPA